MGKRAAKAGVIGAILGAIAGVFFLAPKGAKENREDLKKGATKAAKAGEKKLKELLDELNSKIDYAKGKADVAKGAASKDLKVAIKTAEKVKDRVKIALSNIHEGTSEAREDIEGILKDGKSAISKLHSK